MAVREWFIFFTSLVMTVWLFNTAFACTDFRLTAKDGTILVTRSMEFALDLKSNLRTSPRGRNFNSVTPNGKPGLSWKAKYGYVFLDALDQDLSTDGMNEKGLSFEALYLPGLAHYQTVPDGQEGHALGYLNFGDWVLSNFQSVDEVRAALPSIYVVTQKVPGMNDTIFPLHYSIHDANGKSLVVEYVDGKLNIYDNQIGVMTNSPAYSWHMTNLENYLHLAPTNPQPVTTDGATFAVLGQGFGMIGLPGDITPPARFVKMATFLKVVLPAEDATKLINLAEHIINNVDIPLGLARESDNGNPTNELTQWVVFKDLTHKNFYYRTYNNLTLRSVSLTDLNFNENAPRLKMPIISQPNIQNVTEQFVKSEETKSTT